MQWMSGIGMMTVGFALCACSASKGSPPDPGKGSTGGANDPGPASGGGGSFGVGSGGSCAASCSADLKNVVDCHGVVLLSCTGDEACLNGRCTDDPCGAAEAAKSSYGCDYFALQPDIISEGLGACFAAYVANTWSVPVHIDVYRDGQLLSGGFIQVPQGQGQSLTYTPYDTTQGLAPGEVAIVFLAHADPPQSTLPLCPFAPAFNGLGGVLGTGLGEAFNIVTDRPVVAYSIFPYGGGQSQATSATLLLPTSAWDTNYIGINAYAKSAVAPTPQPSLAVLAHEDNTQVTILPSVAIVGGNGVAAAAANTPAVYHLDAGQYLQLSQDIELTGSPIQSDKTVGLWGAASCLSVPVTASACDSAHQQIPPVKALGSKYAGVRYRNRASAPGEEAPPWRLVGAVDGTQLTWQPSMPFGAPASINAGEVHEFFAAGPMVVSSQDADHPFYFAQYMTGVSYEPTAGEGDPEWVNVIPVDQYLDSYVFFTDPTYSETSLVVTRRKSTLDGLFKDVSLGCAGVLTDWQPVGDYEYTRIDLVTGNFQNVGNCSNGRHEMSSEAPFGVTVWGWGTEGLTPSTDYVSYAYPAGASIQPINEVVVPPTPK